MLGNQTVQSCKLISPRETYDLAQKGTGVLLLDVRTRGEYNNELGHVAHTLLIPINELERRVGELEPRRKDTIVAICRSGARSGRATELLAQLGFVAINMEGGMIRWNREGLPVARGGDE